jgi:hypothetical protein
VHWLSLVAKLIVGSSVGGRADPQVGQEGPFTAAWQMGQNPVSLGMALRDLEVW